MDLALVNDRYEELQKVVNRNIEEFKPYLDLKIDGVDDKEGYEKVKKSLRVVVTQRTSLDKTRKELGKEALEFKRAVDDKAKELKFLLEPFETHLKAEKERIDEEKARIAEEKRIRGEIAACWDEAHHANQKFDERKAEEARLEQQRKEQEAREAELKRKEEEIARREREAQIAKEAEEKGRREAAKEFKKLSDDSVTVDGVAVTDINITEDPAVRFESPVATGENQSIKGFDEITPISDDDSEKVRAYLAAIGEHEMPIGLTGDLKNAFDEFQAAWANLESLLTEVERTNG